MALLEHDPRPRVKTFSLQQQLLQQQVPLQKRSLRCRPNQAFLKDVARFVTGGASLRRATDFRDQKYNIGSIEGVSAMGVGAPSTALVRLRCSRLPVVAVIMRLFGSSPPVSSCPSIGDACVAGTWAWGNKFLFNYDTSMDPELQQVFEYSVAQGINVFDTADSYGTGALNGRSEQLLGQFIKDLPYRDASKRVHIATKLAGYPWRVTPWNMTAACKCAS